MKAKFITVKGVNRVSAAASRILLRVVELWLENIGCGMVESESFLDSTRRMVGLG